MLRSEDLIIPESMAQDFGFTGVLEKQAHSRLRNYFSSAAVKSKDKSGSGIIEFSLLSRALIFMLLSSVSSLIWADGLYLQTLKNTQLTKEQIQKSLKKLEEYKKVALRGELEVPPFHKRGKADDSLEIGRAHV